MPLHTIRVARAATRRTELTHKLYANFKRHNEFVDMVAVLQVRRVCQLHIYTGVN